MKVDKLLECGHLKKSVKCSDDIKSIQCSKHFPCNRKLKCGHKCKKMCYEDCQCNVIVCYDKMKCNRPNNYYFFNKNKNSIFRLQKHIQNADIRVK